MVGSNGIVTFIKEEESRVMTIGKYLVGYVRLAQNQDLEED